MNSMRLKEFIRSLRLCSTAGEERSLVNRECANIRQGFQEGTPYLRTRCMLKLLYVRMLGYPTEFGQLEVVNLISQTDFSGKRLGYLALQLMLDEKDEVLTLSENRMKADLSSGNPLVQAVALNAAANIASEDMGRDIFDEVMKLVESHNEYIRKKACLAALRIVKKVPEHAEYFLDVFVDMFSDHRIQGLLCSLTLVNECLQTEQGKRYLSRYRNLATAAVRALKGMVLSSRTTECDVKGITDPFLQVKLLEFMRIIGKGSAVISDTLNDTLAQVITNTDSSRNVGCSIQYECIRTINAIESDDGLRALGVNTIRRFLISSGENNLRFVALEMLLQYAEDNLATVQKLQPIIFECLKDIDISIRRRALELTFALITDENVRLLVPDLLAYLAVCPDALRKEVTERLCTVLETKSPTEEWRVELSIRLMREGKHYAPPHFGTRFIALLSNQPSEIQSHTVEVLWMEACNPFDVVYSSRKALLMVTLWAIGEYANYLIDDKGVSAAKVVEVLGEITSSSAHPYVKLYGVTASMKVASKYPEGKMLALQTFGIVTSSLECELQQRACEYTVLLKDFPQEAKFSFGRMPPIKPAKEEDVQPVQLVSVSPETLRQQTASALDELFDFGGPKPDPGSTQTIDALFGETPIAPAQAHADPFANVTSPLTQPSASAAEVFSCADFSVFLDATMSQPSVITTQVKVVSKCGTPLEDLSFQVAAPKTCTMDVAPLCSTTIAPFSSLIQEVSVNTANHKNARQLMLRVKLLYIVDRHEREELFQISRCV